MIKLFVSDIDGTLLNHKHVLAKETEEAITRLRNAGIEFMLASGRHYEGILRAIQNVDEKPRCITLNGGDVRDYDGTSLLTSRISETTLETLQTLSEQFESPVEYYCEGKAFTQVPLDRIDEVYTYNFSKMFDTSLEEASIFIKELDLKNNMLYEEDFSKIKKYHPLKIEYHFHTMEEKQKAIGKLSVIEDIQVSSSAPLNVEITHIDASKGNMLKQFCAKYGYDEREVVVIGDSENDLSMLSVFMHSYAMGNAEEKIKKSARFIAPSNKENGVAHIMDKIIEWNQEERCIV